MKMTFLQRDNSKRNKKRRTLSTVVVILITFVLISFISPKIFPGKMNDLGKPIWIFRNFVIENSESFLEILKEKSFLVAENNRLEGELGEARVRLLKISLLEKENKDLKEITSTTSGTIGRVLSRASQSPYGTIIVEIGRTKPKSMKVGQEVFSEDFILIGTVDDVYGTKVRVKLLSAPGNKHDVEVGDELIPATAEGLGAGNFKIELPRGVSVTEGDKIISPDLSIKLLGVVEYIKSRPQDSIQEILFKSPVNINQLKWVTIGPTI